MENICYHANITANGSPKKKKTSSERNIRTTHNKERPN
jgi:hypothetical protein